MRYRDMLVETPVPLADIEDRSLKPGHEDQNMCTYCGVQADMWRLIADITVIRIWTSASKWNPDNENEWEQGGKWNWYCRDHLASKLRNGWAPNSHRAPPHLLPEITQPCVRVGPLKRKCEEPAVDHFEQGWMCEHHAVAERNSRLANALLNDT